MLKKSLMFVLFFVGIVEAAVRVPTDPTDLLTSPERGDFLKKMKEVSKSIPQETSLFLILGSSLKDIERHPARDSLYKRPEILHMSNEEVDLEILSKHRQFLRANFSNPTTTWLFLDQKFKDRFTSIYFDWSTFKLFDSSGIRHLSILLKMGGHIYVPEPEFGRSPDITQRHRLLPYNPEETNEAWTTRWEEYKKSWSIETVTQLFKEHGFTVQIVPSDSLHDPIFKEIKLNQHYIDNPSPFKVLVATKV
jgi:hypothetical protein